MNRNNKLVLILDQDKELVDDLAVRCDSIGMEVRTAYDPVTAVKHMALEIPDLFIVDLDTPARRDKTFLEVLDSQPETCHAAVIALCNPELDFELARRFASLFAYYVHKSPQAWKKIRIFAGELIDLSPDRNEASVVDENN